MTNHTRRFILVIVLYDATTRFPRRLCLARIVMAAVASFSREAGTLAGWYLLEQA